MKKFNILAKIMMIFIVATMLFTTVFATDGIGYYDAGIKITSISANDIDGDGVYEVSVKYELDDRADNKIGVSLFAYAGDNLFVSDSGFTSFNPQSMTIVAEKQQKQTDEKSGEFVFFVESGDNAHIKTDIEKPFIITVCGDDTSIMPAAASLVISNLPTQPWVSDIKFKNSQNEEIQSFSEESEIFACAEVKNTNCIMVVAGYDNEGNLIKAEFSYGKCEKSGEAYSLICDFDIDEDNKPQYIKAMIFNNDKIITPLVNCKVILGEEL